MTDNHVVENSATQPMPYHEITDGNFAREAAEHFTVAEPKPGTLVLRGPCPRCSTIIDVPIVKSIFRSRGPFGMRRDSPSRSRVEPMMCTCNDEHPNRPEGAYGCGAYWTLDLSEEPS
ncbi:hypothetical protein [Amycolatopsis sp. RTGN1]|uniref:hypothetical protein n=1 Tax=Amycolatopsis ponsaeliensis TaxID=2992142 RepID=UPI002550F3AA|nr:hypothetical protein [Amycolatopsis sp. RTGN1]